MAVIKKIQPNSPSVKNNILYQDIFTSNLIDIYTNDIALIKNEGCVKQSIINLMQTRVGERIFSPFFGSEIHKLLFENFSPQVTSVLSDLIKTAIANFEPRANVINIVVSPQEEDNSYRISIVFSIINKLEPITLEFLLNRTR